MQSEEKQTMDVFRLAAWAHANRKPLIAVAIAIAVIGLCVGIYIWHGNYRESAANDALSTVRPAPHMPGVAPTPPSPDAYLKVANDYPNTAAGARALLIAAAGLFDEGKFKEAEGLFTRFMQDYPDYPLSDQAQLGIAASLEAEGQISEASMRYKEFRERHPSDSAWSEATSALARLYDEQGKPDQALKLYQEMLTKKGNDTWTQEAPILMHEILVKHPELLPKPTPPPATAQTQVLTPQPSQTPGLTVTGANSAQFMERLRSGLSSPPTATGTNLSLPQPSTNRPLPVIPATGAQSAGSGIPLLITNKP